jgi:hypothetical protein
MNNYALSFLFFLICLELGYPTLNRYDPGKTGGLSPARYTRTEMRLSAAFPVPSAAALITITALQCAVSDRRPSPWLTAAARPLFSVAGPLLSLSAAKYLSRETA